MFRFARAAFASVPLAASCLLLPACGDGDSSAPSGSTPDAAPDAVVDAASDSPAETAPDAASDAPPDTVNPVDAELADAQPDQGSTSDAEPPATLDTAHVGFRASRYGVSPFPEASYWPHVAEQYASRVPGAVPAGVWIVAESGDDGTCYVGFPGSGTALPSVAHADTDLSESYLDALDASGAHAWLQVEPANADVASLIKLVMDRYGQHPSVVGFGVDVEWYQSLANPEGKAVTDAEASLWRQTLDQYGKQRTLFLKHWVAAKMPPTVREGLFFIDDSQGLSSLAELSAEFQQWGAHFSPAPVGFQVGYEADEGWWSKLSDPPGDIAAELLGKIPNSRGVFWVDFTVTKVFPIPK